MCVRGRYGILNRWKTVWYVAHDIRHKRNSLHGADVVRAQASLKIDASVFLTVYVHNACEGFIGSSGYEHIFWQKPAQNVNDEILNFLNSKFLPLYFQVALTKCIFWTCRSFFLEHRAAIIRARTCSRNVDALASLKIRHRKPRNVCVHAGQ